MNIKGGCMGSVLLFFDRAFDFFLPGLDPGKAIACPTRKGASIKDIMESLGVPHTEAGQIIFENREIDFSFIPVSGDEIRICSVVQPFDITQKTLLRPFPFDELKFIVDVNAGKLAKILLKLGFDVKFSNACTDREIADIAAAEKRVVLTRDTGLLKRKKIVYAKRVKASDPWIQLPEVLNYFGLDSSDFKFLSRCSLCNVPLVDIEKKHIIHRLAPKTRKYYHFFKICPVCRQIFWKGSHYGDMKKRLEKMGLNIS